MTIDINKLEKLNRERSKGPWAINDSDGSIIGDKDEFIGEFDLSFADEAFILELVNSANELIRLAKLGSKSK